MSDLHSFTMVSVLSTYPYRYNLLLLFNNDLCNCIDFRLHVDLKHIYIYIERLYVSSIDYDLSLNLQMDICLKINWLCF